MTHDLKTGVFEVLFDVNSADLCRVELGSELSADRNVLNIKTKVC